MQMRFLGWACALLFAGAAHAQSAGVVNLSVTPTSGSTSVTPRLTWSTSPAATSCTASGGWSGTKAASGAQTLSAVTANTSYTLTCTWGSGSARVRWNAPTTNTDGSALTNLARYRVVYGRSTSSLTNTMTVDDITQRSATLNSLASGMWYFAVNAVNTSGAVSANSNIASKNITASTAARTVSVSVASASLTTKATNVWDVKQRSDGVWLRNRVVASIPLGKPCYRSFQVSAKHFLVNRSDVTKFYYTPASTNLVVNCIGD